MRFATLIFFLIFVLSLGLFAAYFTRDDIWLRLVGAASPIAIAASALIAIASIRHNRRQAEKGMEADNQRAKLAKSFDHIVRQTTDHDLILLAQQINNLVDELKTKFNKSKFNSEDVRGVIVKHNDHAIYATDIIRKLFNYYEATAIGIELGALDEKVIEGWWKTSYVRDWRAFKIYIEEKRVVDKIPRLYEKYQAQVKKWDADVPYD